MTNKIKAIIKGSKWIRKDTSESLQIVLCHQLNSSLNCDEGDWIYLKLTPKYSLVRGYLSILTGVVLQALRSRYEYTDDTTFSESGWTTKWELDKDLWEDAEKEVSYRFYERVNENLMARSKEGLEIDELLGL